MQYSRDTDGHIHIRTNNPTVSAAFRGDFSGWKHWFSVENRDCFYRFNKAGVHTCTAYQLNGVTTKVVAELPGLPSLIPAEAA